MNGYFYIDNQSKQQCGPFSLSELETKNIRPDTMVWHSGMTDWVQASTVSELAFLFRGTASSDSFSDQSSTQKTTIDEANYNQQQHPHSITNPQNGQYNNNRQYVNNSYLYNMGNQSEVRPMPKNWLVESILVTIFCCWPFGIAGIVAANKVDSLYYMGDYDGAVRASRNAKKWTLIGFFTLIALGLLYFLFFFVLGMISAL